MTNILLKLKLLIFLNHDHDHDHEHDLYHDLCYDLCHDHDHDHDLVRVHDHDCFF